MAPIELVQPDDDVTADVEFCFPDLMDVIGRYMVCSFEQQLVIALWIVHTHCWQQFNFTPYLLVTSPQKQCGKSRLLELVSLLVASPLTFIMPSEAVVFRTIEAHEPTLLLDEIDAIFAPQAADRAVLNAGFQRGATVPRCVPPKNNVKLFHVFCPKLIAGIGTLPDTIVDRSVPIRLQRKDSTEKVERFRAREAEAVTVPIHTALDTWAQTHGDRLGEARPEIPTELSDRQQDACEPLVAIADALGCGAEARDALVALLTAEREDSTDNAGVRMLRDIRDVFAGAGNPVNFKRDTLVHLLNGDDFDWNEFKPITNTRIRGLLKPYKIEDKTVRLSPTEVDRGYLFADFEDAWRRYL
jgi:hypothetical protein